jgi:hypothetical protein
MSNESEKMVSDGVVDISIFWYLYMHHFLTKHTIKPY